MPPGTELETKRVALLDVKMGDDGNGYLEGYASVKGNIDHGNDRVMPGAYKNIAEFVKSGVSGFNHDAVQTNALPVGYIADAKEDDRGLWVKINFHSHQAAQDVRKTAQERHEAGKDVGMSFAYATDDFELKSEDGKQVRELKAVRIYEAGFVSLPMNSAAGATSVKSGVPFDQQIESLLVGIEDAKSRLETFRADRAQGLSEKNVERAKALRDGLDALIDSPKQEPLDPEALKALEPNW